MIEFSDLNNEIGADDWLIPSGEISRRRLIKQTPRFNVYKADWFGDVLVYEPVQHQQAASRCARSQLQSEFECHKKFNQEELSSRLSELSLDKSKLYRSQISLNSDTSREHIDSAYSSISSTPQYHTKDFKCGFEFPCSSLSSSTVGSISSLVDENNSNLTDELDLSRVTIQKSNEKQMKQIVSKTSPVILNKDSYILNKVATNFEDDSYEGKISTTGRTCWNELNELRLIAHESFMLFMGASLDDAYESTSLVMQMNHPKAVSLYNLLHATKLATIKSNNFLYSPIDRFFSNKQQQQLNIEGKLNICQQVTNAMTYLHDKDIVHGKLTSVNIYLELNQRVKISLIDESEAAIASTMLRGHNHNSVKFNLPALTYLSPELIKTISFVGTKSSCDNNEQASHVQVDKNQLTKKLDVFSFGTLLYELFEERFPFSEARDPPPVSRVFNSPCLPSTPTGLTLLDSLASWNGNIKASANELIFQIGSGQTEAKNLNKHTNKCPPLVEFIISACWSTNANMRPQFKQISFA